MRKEATQRHQRLTQIDSDWTSAKRVRFTTNILRPELGFKSNRQLLGSLCKSLAVVQQQKKNNTIVCLILNIKKKEMFKFRFMKRKQWQSSLLLAFFYRL